MKSKPITIIPIPQCYRYQLSFYPSVSKYIHRCDDIECWFVKESDLKKFIDSLNSLLEENDYDLILGSIINDVIDDMSITLENDACPVISQS